jgi:hypothetical protein
MIMKKEVWFLTLAVIAILVLALLPNAASAQQFAEQRTWGGTSTGTANAQTIVVPNYNAQAPVPLRFRVGSGLGNTGSVTLTVSNGVGGTQSGVVVESTWQGNETLAGGELVPGAIALVQWDPVDGYFQLLSTSTVPGVTAETFNVRSGVDGCARAAGNGSVDDYPAIQCLINYVYSNYGAGIIDFPCGAYLVDTTVTVKGAITLRGLCGQLGSYLKTNTDIGVLSFDSTSSYAGARDIGVYGYANASSISNAISIAQNIPIFLDRMIVQQGSAALSTQGVDGTYTDCYFAGYTYGVVAGGVSGSQAGSNNFVRDKIDGPVGGGVGTTYSYYQGESTSSENQFTDTDFSGTWSYSFLAADGTGSGTATFTGSTFNRALNFTGFAAAMFAADKFAENISSGAAAIMISSSYSTVGITVSGLTHTCAAVINISCP